jgi:hypothetical protein
MDAARLQLLHHKLAITVTCSHFGHTPVSIVTTERLELHA